VAKTEPAARPSISPRAVRNVRIGLVTVVAVFALLIFAVPRATPPPATLANPNEAFVDRAGIVSTDFARQWAGALLNDDRAEIVIYVDRKPPAGDLASWAIQTATDWKVGASKNDTGLVLFVFTEPRIARLDVGYGLEAVITDARARQLLEAHLAPSFAVRQYERGFDALILGIRKEIGGDDAASIHARAAEARKRDDVPWTTTVADAFQRAPRMVSATTRNFLEGSTSERFVILLFAAVGLGIAATGAAIAVNTAWRLSTLPAALRARSGREGGPALAKTAYEIVMGVFLFGICLAMITLALLAVEGFFTRQGRFSGAGSAIVWPQPPR
jgi:uncharacterized membrane protein YgcG